jgi:phage baseplate assembly protein W
MGFLGTGWRFPVATAPGGATAGPIAKARDDEKIAQAIWIILTTTPGERVMRPDFGCGLNRLVFADLGEATIGQVIQSVERALARWEPRIDVLSVDATPDSGQENVLLIDIDYVVLATNSRFNLVYPFYLG